MRLKPSSRRSHRHRDHPTAGTPIDGDNNICKKNKRIFFVSLLLGVSSFFLYHQFVTTTLSLHKLVRDYAFFNLTTITGTTAIGEYFTYTDSLSSEAEGRNTTTTIKDASPDAAADVQQDEPPRIQQLQPKLQIVGFTDKTFVPIAIKWYNRLLELGYLRSEIILVCHDEESFSQLQQPPYNFTVEACFITNPDYRHPVKGFWRQLMQQRLQFTLHKLEAGISVLVTDVDNVFMRHVPLAELYKEPYDVIHAHEMRYPTWIFEKMGFVVCSGHQWLKATPATIHFLKIVLDSCRIYNPHTNEKCDDQVAYNLALSSEELLQMEWSTPTNPNSSNAKRIPMGEEFGAMMNGLLLEEMHGKSKVTNHTVKIWDRDYATRWSGDPIICPSRERNWVAMPTGLKSVEFPGIGKIPRKLAIMDAWIKACGPNGTVWQNSGKSLYELISSSSS